VRQTCVCILLERGSPCDSTRLGRHLRPPVLPPGSSSGSALLLANICALVPNMVPVGFIQATRFPAALARLFMGAAAIYVPVALARVMVEWRKRSRVSATHAVQARQPVVGMYMGEAGGSAAEWGWLEADAQAELLLRQMDASGVIPQLSVCLGGACLVRPHLADFVLTVVPDQPASGQVCRCVCLGFSISDFSAWSRWQCLLAKIFASFSWPTKTIWLIKLCPSLEHATLFNLPSIGFSWKGITCCHLTSNCFSRAAYLGLCS
jgi:hypothetical protein